MKISKEFNLVQEQSELDFVDLNLSKDTMLFLNPLQFTQKNFKKVEGFLFRVYDLYKDNRRDEALELFYHSSECNFNHLGYSNGGSRGRGASMEMLTAFFDKILQEGDDKAKLMLTPMALVVHVSSFAEDRMSDLLFSILKREFVDYTLNQAKLHHIPISDKKISYGFYWDSDLLEWRELFNYCIFDSNDFPVILTPKEIVCKSYPFSAYDFVQKILLPKRQEELFRQGIGKFNSKKQFVKLSLKEVYEIEITKAYSDQKSKLKKYIEDQELNQPTAYELYIEEKKRKSSYHTISDEELSDLTD
ncbi:hypothetical protein SAMN05216470_1015 [Streptococcus equinus]|uniref:Uncharacterized protein n=1 Tax=Streptococcus equinus TaxID=1335 RepID=A0A239RAF3_STREI|nr:hypothetical protein [Streptococcus equinus]SNU07574.1 hypothetical protein SAMN05216470_1015 [Streptococcus equinus]